MKYSLPFYVGNPYIDTAEEISIKYDAKDERSLTSFLDKHINQRVVIKISKNNKLTEKNYSALQQIIKMYPQETVVCCFESLNLSDVQSQLPHFFDYYCYDIEQIQTLLSLGATDIYVTGNLCFHLPQIKEKFKCNIRVFPNITQSSILESDDEKKFFIRPEDIILFEPYIDYLEFYTSDLKKTALLYKIYKIQKEYSGLLSEIITDAPKNIYNEYLSPALANERIYCKKSCIYYGRECNICHNCFHMADALYTKQHTIVLNKAEN